MEIKSYVRIYLDYLYFTNNTVTYFYNRFQII